MALSSSPGQWAMLGDRIEKSLEDVLNDIIPPPRAQTAPPPAAVSLGEDLSLGAFDSGHLDIRLDQAYTEFYLEQVSRSSHAHLPVPLDNTTLFSQFARQIIHDHAQGRPLPTVSPNPLHQQIFESLVNEIGTQRPRSRLAANLHDGSFQAGQSGAFVPGPQFGEEGSPMHGVQNKGTVHRSHTLPSVPNGSLQLTPRGCAAAARHLEPHELGIQPIAMPHSAHSLDTPHSISTQHLAQHAPPMHSNGATHPSALDEHASHLHPQQLAPPPNSVPNSLHSLPPGHAAPQRPPQGPPQHSLLEVPPQHGMPLPSQSAPHDGDPQQLLRGQQYDPMMLPGPHHHPGDHAGLQHQHRHAPPSSMHAPPLHMPHAPSMHPMPPGMAHVPMNSMFQATLNAAVQAAAQQAAAACYAQHQHGMMPLFSMPPPPHVLSYPGPQGPGHPGMPLPGGVMAQHGAAGMGFANPASGGHPHTGQLSVRQHMAMERLPPKHGKVAGKHADPRAIKHGVLEEAELRRERSAATQRDRERSTREDIASEVKARGGALDQRQRADVVQRVKGGGALDDKVRKDKKGGRADERKGGAAALGGKDGQLPAKSAVDVLVESGAAMPELKGKIMVMTREQHGCRYLQKQIDEGGNEALQMVFEEILEHAASLMMDPFGNYLVQKVLDACHAEQRMQLLKQIAASDFVAVALNTHGTRAVQKLIEQVNGEEEVSILTNVLKLRIVELIKDLNGNHVVQRCLQKLNSQYTSFIYDAACDNCLDIAQHRHGCCVLQRCIDFATAEQKVRLVTCIAAHGLELSNNAFGNYVIQYILDAQAPGAGTEILTQLKGHFPELSCQKFSSNVVEKCLKLQAPGLEVWRETIVEEIVLYGDLAGLLKDQFGNYVVQSALRVTSGDLHTRLVAAIKPHLAALRSMPHGKRILQQVQGK